MNISFGGGRVKSKALTTFTRQLATLIDAGLALLRGLEVLRKGEKNPTLRGVISMIAESAPPRWRRSRPSEIFLPASA